MDRDKFFEFCKAAGIRAAKTFFQTILAMWTVGAIITELDWKLIFVTAASAAVYSLLTSIVAGLPEVDLSDAINSMSNSELDSMGEGGEDE